MSWPWRLSIPLDRPVGTGPTILGKFSPAARLKGGNLKNLSDNVAAVATSNTIMLQTEPSDADDVRLTLDGNREAFGRLYDRHARTVRAVVVAVSGDFGAVEDLTQETFLRGFCRLTTLRDAAGFRNWIQGVARFVARERRRQLSRERDRHRIEEDDSRLEPADNADVLLERDEEQRRLMSAIAELPERERLTLHAYYFHEQSADQAAAVIGMSRSGFYAALDRGMVRLRNRLGVISPTHKRREQ
jgi:RNA polymerase sigma factor (sigma-70 family)